MDSHERPDKAANDVVRAAGKVSEALETVERARGHLYDFHQLIGSADLGLDEAVRLLRESGHDALAQRVQEELIGRNVIEGHWTFQIVEDFDDNYWSAFRALEHEVRDELVDGHRHVYEAEMKQRRRTHGARHHEMGPT